MSSVAKGQIIAALVIFLSANCSPAEWQVVGTRNTAGEAGLMLRQVELEDTQTSAEATVDLAIFSTESCRLRLIDNAEASSDLRSAMERNRCLAGVNGGYFDPNFSPLGLRVVDGAVTSRLTRGRLLTGIAASDTVTRLFRLSEFLSKRKLEAAVQCGPFLVDGHRAVRGLESTRSARRTFIAMETGDRAALGFCSEASLSELGRILVIPLGDFKVQRALNLDGGSSSAFWFKRENGGAFSIGEQKAVRDFVAVVPR